MTVRQDRVWRRDAVIPMVVQAYATDGYHVVAQFDDGRVVLWDASPLINRGGVFARLRDSETFRAELAVLNGTVAWSRDLDPTRCLDVDPAVVYEQGEDITARVSAA
jgi:hypothetical protein